MIRDLIASYLITACFTALFLAVSVYTSDDKVYHPFCRGKNMGYSEHNFTGIDMVLANAILWPLIVSTYILAFPFWVLYRLIKWVRHYKEVRNREYLPDLEEETHNNNLYSDKYLV